MSSGDHRHTGQNPSHLSAAISQVAVKRELHRPFVVNRDFDIPYLAGYSKDAGTIFIDRHLPKTVKIGTKTINPEPFLIVHERTEKALIDGVGFSYFKAHRYAMHEEEAQVRARKIDPAQYEKALAPYIKADEHELITAVPSTLDLTPYRGSTELLKHMRAHMKVPGNRAATELGRMGIKAKADKRQSEGL